MKPEDASPAQVNLAKNLLELRTLANLSRAQLSKLCGIGIDQLRHLEKPTRGYSDDSLARIAAVFGCQPSHLISEDPPKWKPLEFVPAFSLQWLVAKKKDVPPEIAKPAEKAVKDANLAYSKWRKTSR